MIYVGIDNGVSGSIAAVTEMGVCLLFRPMPVWLAQDYPKKKKNINRIDTRELKGLLCTYIVKICSPAHPCHVLVERPMVNPTRFTATGSALRALEATLIALEALSLRYEFVDSKQWQKVMLPNDIKGSDLLKIASRDIGIRLFPEFKSAIEKHKDADSLLLAEAARRGRW